MSNKIYIGKTDVGKGLFAAKKIKKGELILTVTGPVIFHLTAKKKGNKQADALQIDISKYMDLSEPSKFANHSCKPNSGLKKDVKLVALKNIAKNEEIRFDYSTTMYEGYWTMKCKCGSKNCRGKIEDFDFLPENLQELYLSKKIVQRFIAEQY